MITLFPDDESLLCALHGNAMQTYAALGKYLGQSIHRQRNGTAPDRFMDDLNAALDRVPWRQVARAWMQGTGIDDPDFESIVEFSGRFDCE